MSFPSTFGSLFTSDRLLSNRGLFGVVAVAASVLIAVALYMQYVQELDPCNLCLFQRFFIIAAGAVALIACVHNAKAWGAAIWAVLVLVLSSLGFASAGRQIWLQHLPADQVPACGPGLDYMMDVYPFTEMIVEVFRGSGDCAKVQWVFMGLSIPEWGALCFSAAIIIMLVVLVRSARRIK